VTKHASIKIVSNVVGYLFSTKKPTSNQGTQRFFANIVWEIETRL